MQATFHELLKIARIEESEDLITESAVREKFDDFRTLITLDIFADDGGEAPGGLLRGKTPQVVKGGVGDRVGIGFHEPG